MNGFMGLTLTYSSQSTATIIEISSVGRPTAVNTINIVTRPALGIEAAPIDAKVAVRLKVFFIHLTLTSLSPFPCYPCHMFWFLLKSLHMPLVFFLTYFMTYLTTITSPIPNSRPFSCAIKIEATASYNAVPS